MFVLFTKMVFETIIFVYCSLKSGSSFEKKKEEKPNWENEKKKSNFITVS